MSNQNVVVKPLSGAIGAEIYRRVMHRATFKGENLRATA